MAFEERQVVSLDNENRGLPGLVVCVIFVALATVATGLRVLSKRMLRLQLAADDYWVIAALVCEPQSSDNKLTHVDILIWVAGYYRLG